MRTLVLKLTVCLISSFNAASAYSTKYYVYLNADCVAPLGAIDMACENNMAKIGQVTYLEAGTESLHKGIFEALLKATFLGQPESNGKLVAHMYDAELKQTSDRFKVFISIDKMWLKQMSIGDKSHWSLRVAIKKMRKNSAIEEDFFIDLYLRP